MATNIKPKSVRPDTPKELPQVPTHDPSTKPDELVLTFDQRRILSKAYRMILSWQDDSPAAPTLSTETGR
jgi:hypothetical protein